MTKAVIKIGYDSYLVSVEDALRIAEILANAVQVNADYDNACGWQLGDRVSRTNAPTVQVLSMIDLTELELGSD